MVSAATWGTINDGSSVKKIKILIYGHVYNKDKNNPINKMRVYIKKNWQELASGKTDASGRYDIIHENRDDLLNLCIESTEFSSIKNVSLCETVSVFQKIGTIVDDVEVRELEQDFYTNEKWENLNESYVKEITHSDEEAAFSEYEDNMQYYQDKADKAKTQEILSQKLDEDKAKYKMPANTEMTGPLKSIQVIVSLMNGKEWNTWSGSIWLLPDETTLKFYSHQWELLREVKLSKLYDANFTVFPKGDPVFLNPAVLRVENSQTKTSNWKIVPAFNQAHFLLTKEKNIINFTLEENNPGYMDRMIERQETMPIIPILLIIWATFWWFYIVTRNKIDVLRGL